MRIRQISVYQQTQALLCKNFLKKWRMKRESALEWGFPILLGLYLGLLSGVRGNAQLPEIPPQDLGRIDKFNISSIIIVYMPISNITQKIMNTTAFAPLMKGTRIIGVPDKKDMDEVLFEYFPHAMGIIFSDTFSYKLKFIRGYYVPFLRDDLTDHCWEIYGEYSCVLSRYWERGFVTLQTIINAAIIEVTTNHSVIDELMSVTAINMKTLPFISKDIFQCEMFILYCLLYFFPFTYFVSLNITKERKKCKELMKMMGLHDSAFWLSWGLMYTAFIFIISIFITIIITSTQVILMTGFMVIFTLLFLYGLSLLALSFLMSVLLQKAVLTNLFVFLLTLFWGFVGFTAFYKQLPPSVQWILSICSPFALRAGMTQILHLDYNLNGVVFPDPSGESYTMLATFSVLAFDGLIYLMLALYFDKILPYGNEHRYSPLFFLSSSSCFRHRRTDNTVIEKDLDPEHPSDDYFEPIPSEFQGKEAIRISPQIQNVPVNPEIHVDEDEDEDVQAERMRASSALTTSNINENPVIIASCLHKEYAGQRKSCFSKRKKKIAARNISFCVKKGEVLGLLGPNGAGKSSSIRMIAGITKPTAGQVELRVGECKSFLGQQGDGMVKFLGYCPQENVLWPTLTMKEHLEVYATVKGLQKEDAAIVISRLVNAFNLYEQLNVPVQKLASGTTRKLCFVLSILGNSPILLLDEPSTGIDPTGQQQIWQAIQAAVKNTEKSVLLTTHYLAEAEALCDRVAIMVSGRLRCIGSIQHLKRKFGKDYILELKVKEPSQVPLIHTEILNLFPQAAQQERFSSLLTFKLPIADVYPLSQAFYKLETVKHNFNLEEYSLSQCTLEKVFLEFFKKPEPENVDEEVDTTMRWKLLSYSDEP
nr:ATP-binding cassette sub-family A member 6-like [Marmota flaviventris]